MRCSPFPWIAHRGSARLGAARFSSAAPFVFVVVIHISPGEVSHGVEIWSPSGVKGGGEGGTPLIAVDRDVHPV